VVLYPLDFIEKTPYFSGVTRLQMKQENHLPGVVRMAPEYESLRNVRTGSVGTMIRFFLADIFAI
jgi:hypothetical protein